MKARTLWIVGILLAFAMVAPFSASAKVKGDRDRNGIPDKWEVRHGLKKKSSAAKSGKLQRIARKTAIRVANADPDSDELSNVEEWRGKTDPKDSDSDGDGVLDGDENGLVISFNGHYLRLLVPGEGIVQGIVDEDTLVFCEPDESDLVDEEEEDTSDSYSEQGDVDENELDFASQESASEADDLLAEVGLCDASYIETGLEVVYADEDDGFFSDVTLNVAATTEDSE